MKTKLSTLHNTQPNRPALILGGGPSLPTDYQRIMQSLSGESEANAVEVLHIAVNYHADLIGIPHDYIV